MMFAVFSIFVLMTAGSLAVPYGGRHPHHAQNEQEQRAREEYQQLLRERQQEQQEMQLEELRELVESTEGLQQIAEQLGLDLVGRSMRPYLRQTTVAPLEDCVTRSAVVEMEQRLTSGIVTYRVCGVGVDTKIQFRFFVPGETTPVADTTTPVADITTPIETTTEVTTIPPENVTTTPLTPTRPAGGCGCPAVLVVSVQHQAPPAPPAVSREETTVEPEVENNLEAEQESPVEPEVENNLEAEQETTMEPEVENAAELEEEITTMDPATTMENGELEEPNSIVLSTP